MASAVVDKAAWARDFLGGVPPEGGSLVAEREHVSHCVLRALLILVFSFLVAE